MGSTRSSEDNYLFQVSSHFPLPTQVDNSCQEEGGLSHTFPTDTRTVSRYQVIIPCSDPFYQFEELLGLQKDIIRPHTKVPIVKGTSVGSCLNTHCNTAQAHHTLHFTQHYTNLFVPPNYSFVSQPHSGASDNSFVPQPHSGASDNLFVPLNNFF